MSRHTQCEEMLQRCEKLLRDCDTDLETAPRGTKSTRERRRNAVNAACNALHRATRA